MIARIRGAWGWFADGLTEACLWFVERLSGGATHRIVIGEGSAAIEAPDGSGVGRLLDREGSVHFEPAEAAQALAGSRIDILVPPGWLFRRDLDPVAVQSVPFLEGFVRHHIEKITPWHAADVHYAIRQTALAADPTRMAIEVSVVPRRLVAAWVAALETQHPRRMRLMSRTGSRSDDFGIPIGTGTSLLAATLRDRIVLGLAVLLVCFVGALGWLGWRSASVQDDVAEQDRVLDERSAVLARARRLDQGAKDMDAKLLDIRNARPRVVDVIEALAKALPDSAHLTDLSLHKSQMTVAGVSTDTSLLVPALEKSGRFADVAFGASTTKVEAGPGDRFQLDMRVREPAAAGP